MSWLLQNWQLVAQYGLSHLSMTVPAVVVSFLLSLPLAWIARRWRLGRAAIIGAVGLVYAIPSLPLFVILPMLIGTTVRDRLNVVAAMSLYGLALMARSATDALGSADEGAGLAATALGYGRLQRFLTVDLPLSGPALLAGLRVVSLSTVSLVTMSALLGVPSLGMLFTDGFQRGITTEVLVGVVSTTMLALVLDLLLVGIGRLLLPWTRRTSRWTT